ncbi:MAG: tail fiber protein [Verrucomicrobiota bacterium]|jgi:microcystin-dependent protein
MDPFIGELRLFGFNFAPVGWALCQGQLLQISQNAALFSILGTQYGGNGTSNFGLPNLQGMVPIGQGSGPGLTPFVPGQTGGQQTHTLTANEMPQHSHALNALPVRAVNETPAAGSRPSEGVGGSRGSSFEIKTYTTNSPGTNLNPAAVGAAGSGIAHDNMQPTLTMNWCIAMVGVFPTRS